MSPGALLREVRRKHGVTQRQLAARARTSQAAISRIERGTVSPTVATLGRLLDLLGERLILDVKRINYPHVDKKALRANLKLTPEERIRRGVARSNKLRRKST
jgi:transcriptional regulator with XRE-family HTH domain